MPPRAVESKSTIDTSSAPMRSVTVDVATAAQRRPRRGHPAAGGRPRRRRRPRHRSMATPDATAEVRWQAPRTVRGGPGPVGGSMAPHVSRLAQAGRQGALGRSIGQFRLESQRRASGARTESRWLSRLCLASNRAVRVSCSACVSVRWQTVRGVGVLRGAAGVWQRCRHCSESLSGQFEYNSLREFMTPIDYWIIGIVVVSALLGALRGLFREVLTSSPG